MCIATYDLTALRDYWAFLDRRLFSRLEQVTFSLILIMVTFDHRNKSHIVVISWGILNSAHTIRNHYIDEMSLFVTLWMYFLMFAGICQQCAQIGGQLA